MAGLHTTVCQHVFPYKCAVRKHTVTSSSLEKIDTSARQGFCTDIRTCGGILREPWAPHGAYYWGLCTDICTCGASLREPWAPHGTYYGASALTSAFEAGLSGSLGPLMVRIIGASVLAFVLVAGHSGIIRDTWAPHGAYY